MRLKLTLQLLPEVTGRTIPINYQYELSSAIYNILSDSNSEYATRLHNQGFRMENKQFKLFSFSRLIAPFRIDREKARLVFKSDYVEWYLAFLPPESMQEFIKGVFANRRFEIADSVSGASFEIREVQVMPELVYTPETVFETMSPVCISQMNARGKADYLSPVHEKYTEAILTGLSARYHAFYGKEFKGETYCRLHLLSEPRSSLVTIKAGTPAETRVRGYSFRFRLELPLQLLEIAYESGLGEKDSLGFGMIKTI